MKHNNTDDVPEFMRVLCPTLSEDELCEATDRLARFLEIASRIRRRLSGTHRGEGGL